MKNLMHYNNNNPDQEQMVYLIWEQLAGRATLACICTTDADLDRYITADRKHWLGKPEPVFVEKVLCDHLYGGNDMAIAARIMRRS